MKKYFKWGILIIILLLILSFLFKIGESKTKKNLEVNREWLNFSTEKETEIFYRFKEIYSQVQKKEGIEVLPEIGQKEWKTPKKDKAIQITADEYNISTKQVGVILENVEKRKPTDEEFRIFKIYDDKLNEAIDTEAAGGTKIDEDKIRQEIAGSLGISQEKLRNIWNRVFGWQEDEKQKNDLIIN